MAFFNHLLWENYAVVFCEIIRVCLSCKGLLLCKFSKPTELFKMFKIELENRDYIKSLLVDAEKKTGCVWVLALYLINS